MFRWVPLFASAVIVGAVACGGLTSGEGGEAARDGGPALPDGAVGAGDVAKASPVCHTWAATGGPVQVSDIPSLVELMSAVPTASGVLVGYADSQFPPVDSSWHLRLVDLPGGTPESDQTPFRRNDKGLGWTAISVAQGSSGFAATASDQTQGMQFAAVDESGAITGTVAHVGGSPGRYLLPTTTGFSVLRSAFNESGTRPPPVTLDMLDPSGTVLSEKTLLDESVKTDWYDRFGLPDRSFLLAWPGTGCCRDVFLRHYSEDGTPLAPAVELHPPGSGDYGAYALAPTPHGFLFAWVMSGSGPYDLMGQPFDANGGSLGPPVSFATHVGGANAPSFTIAPTPAGDLIAAWADGPFTQEGHVYVQSVAADGSAEGTATTLAPIADTDNSIDVLAVASPLGAMVLYENVASGGIEVFGVPLKCED